MSGRLLGLDYGSKTVGVAVSDALGITAQAVETITRTHENKLRRTLARIEAIIAQYGVTGIVLGYPRNMNYTEGERAQKTLALYYLCVVQRVRSGRNYVRDQTYVLFAARLIVRSVLD